MTKWFTFLDNINTWQNLNGAGTNLWVPSIPLVSKSQGNDAIVYLSIHRLITQRFSSHETKLFSLSYQTKLPFRKQWFNWWEKTSMHVGIWIDMKLKCYVDLGASQNITLHLGSISNLSLFSRFTNLWLLMRA